MKFVVVLAVAVLAVALSKPHPRRSSESSSEENPKHKPHHKHHGHHHGHHGHHHRSSTPPAPITEENVTTAEQPDESTRFADITTEPVEIVTSDAATEAVTVEEVTVVPSDSGATVESAATAA
ncbi:hypothetical protein ANCCAN_03226 [Ancylostoma caninum]|uniref:Uncharacterized protein n=1 Tax=Ancylostoma caninum TaxID=29170 RepID=A0A368H1W9_ANCCA|nr:hypothetical protein ANCCAN_03226 [Ancylostoma caninum]